MQTFIVKIFRDGVQVDTQTVTVSEEALASDVNSRIEHNSIKAAAMAQCRVIMQGSFVSYKVEEVERAGWRGVESTIRPHWKQSKPRRHHGQWGNGLA